MGHQVPTQVPATVSRQMAIKRLNEKGVIMSVPVYHPIGWNDDTSL